MPRYPRFIFRRILLLLLLLLSSTSSSSSSSSSSSTIVRYTSAKDNLTVPLEYTVPCSNQYTDPTHGLSPYVPGCSPGNQGPVCGRYIVDNFLSSSEYPVLDSMVNDKIFTIIDQHNDENLPGPAIADINTGYIRSSGGKLYNMYRNTTTTVSSSSSSSSSRSQRSNLFTSTEYDMYRGIISRMRTTLETTFHLTPDSLYFTAPTFITRTIGSRSWRPRMIHDEYYHPHVDKINTDHYDYSALLYLSTYDDDDDHNHNSDHTVDKGIRSNTFTGGKLAFLQVHPHFQQLYRTMYNASWDEENNDTYELLMNPEKDTLDNFLAFNSTTSSSSPMAPAWLEEHIMEPRSNRLVLFSAGLENIHQVQPVFSGNRVVLSLWFTCDKRKQFQKFLDGDIHDRFTGNDDDKNNNEETNKDTNRLSTSSHQTPSPRPETLKEKEQRLKDNRNKRRKSSKSTGKVKNNVAKEEL